MSDEGQRRRSSNEAAASEPRSEPKALRERVYVLERQAWKLLRRTRALRKQVALCGQDRTRLKVRVRGVEREIRKAIGQYAEAEYRSRHFASLYVIVQRLTGLRTRDEVFIAIQEIVTAFIGSEEIAIFEFDDAGAAVVSAAYGVDSASVAELSKSDGIVWRVLQNEQAHFAQRDPDSTAEFDPEVSGAFVRGERPVTACVPLKVSGRVIGALAIFRLFPQKPALVQDDHELLDVLATLSAGALCELGKERGPTERP